MTLRLSSAAGMAAPRPANPVVELERAGFARIGSGHHARNVVDPEVRRFSRWSVWMRSYYGGRAWRILASS